MLLCTEVIVENALRLNSETVKQTNYRIDHHWRSAHEVLDILRSIVILQICLVHDVVYEACHILHARCISCRVRAVKSEMEVEVRELLLNLSIILEVEGLDKASRTIEEVYFLLGLEGLEEMHDVAPERCHAGTTTDEYIFL